MFCEQVGFEVKFENKSEAEGAVFIGNVLKNQCLLSKPLASSMDFSLEVNTWVEYTLTDQTA